MRRQHTMKRERSRAPGPVLALVATLLALPAVGSAAAADGSGYLDPAFGDAGLALTDFTTGEDGADAIVVTPDGGIVATGFGDLGDPVRPHVAGFAFAKYLPNGAPDPSFSGDGRALVDFGFVNQAATTADIDPAGRILATGTITTFDGSTSRIGLTRLLPDGTPDPDFGGGDGLVTIQPGTLSASYDAAIDRQDRIVVLGAATGKGGFRPTVMRFDGSGSLDQSFGDGGIVRFGKAGTDSYGSIAIDRRGRLLLAGASRSKGSKHPLPAVRRMSPAGALDPSYGRRGLGFPLKSMNGGAAAVTLDGSGRPLVTATCGCGPRDSDVFAVGRLTNGGRRDHSFGGDGRTLVAFGATDARPTSIAVDPAGRIVVAGSDRVDGSNDWALARLRSNGKPDRAFGNEGAITATLGAGVEGIRGIAVDSNSRVVAAGLGIGPRSSDFAVARFR